MPRRSKSAFVRELTPDSLFGSKRVTKLINYIMLDGKKWCGERIVYLALDIAVQLFWDESKKNTDLNKSSGATMVSKKKGSSGRSALSNSSKETKLKLERQPGKIKEDGLARKVAIEILDGAIENAMPQVEVRSRRVGGAAYQVPSPVRAKRRLDLAMRWIVEFARASRSRYKSTAESLARELFDAFKGSGNVVKKRDEIHRMANANKTFSHYYW